MKTKYHFGRKNRRTNYRLYKQELNQDSEGRGHEQWFKINIRHGKLCGWNACFELPDDMKPIRKENAEEYLFWFCL